MSYNRNREARPTRSSEVCAATEGLKMGKVFRSGRETRAIVIKAALASIGSIVFVMFMVFIFFKGV